MRVRVLGINGSPRKYGNSARMLLVALHAARRLGASTTIIHLYDYKIAPCQGCYSDSPLECYFPKHGCPILRGEDEFKRLAEAILSSDVILVSTPVYWFNVSGHLKTLIDRLTALENMIHHTGRSLLEGKVAGLMAAGEEAGAAAALSWLALTFNMMGVHIPAWGTAYYHGRGDVLESKEAVNDSYNVGRVAVIASTLLKGKGAGVEHEWYVRLGESDMKEIVGLVRAEVERLKSESRVARPWIQ
ncbi:MAG: flavodoxin family protein [Hyperthermus sp.]|nr:MAG: flavodoxin family protein [Hyperthermus sp.]